ncbi:MAG TPA: cellulase family glycosylhydrolase [Puia sp.]|nr:cellulase family glycosylhydrolase [Puia sp.]
MINSRYLLILIFFAFRISIGFSQGFLKASGPIIVNARGEKVILRGMGLGGWMLQEGYMLRLGNIGQQYRIKEKIQELIGPEKTAAFYDGWLANHTRKIDIDSMAAWGFNSVRLPMHYHLFTPAVDEEPEPGKNTWLSKGFALTDSLLSWCKANKIYLILDLHATPGGQGNDLPISDRDPAKPSLWESEADRQKMIALWAKLAQRYAGEPWIGGYDIINEPNWGFEDPNDRRGTAETRNAPLRKLMMDITAAIRAVDKKHIIIIEGNGFGNNYKGILPAWDDNIVLSFHKYGNFNTETAIRSFLDLREKYNLPLWMGESGENSNTWYTEAIHLVETHDIGWSWWPLKKIGSNNPLEIRLSPAYQQLLDYWNGKGPRPSQQEAESALQGLLADSRLENNVYHKDVTDAMFRQVYSTDTRPFEDFRIGMEPDPRTGQRADPRSRKPDPVVIPAVEYDLGRQGSAYFDRDSASYQYTPGVKTVGNRGHTCRNDGVDITKDTTGALADCPGGNYIFSIENGEWLQYTIRVEKKGRYRIGFRVAATSDTARLSLFSGPRSLTPGSRSLTGSASTPPDALLVQDLPIPNTGGLSNWQTVEVKDIPLEKGLIRLRVLAGKGGFNLAALQLSK